jgi:hypothetical protein
VHLYKLALDKEVRLESEPSPLVAPTLRRLQIVQMSIKQSAAAQSLGPVN